MVVRCGFEANKQNSHQICGPGNGMEKSNIVIKQHMGSLEAHNQDNLSLVHSSA